MKIFEIHLTPNRNYDGAYDVNLVVDEYPTVDRQPIADIDGDIFWYGENTDGAVAFGITHAEGWMGHDANYMWSSRSSVFNGYFDKMCTEVTYSKVGSTCRMSGAINVLTLFNNLTDKYEIAQYKDDDGEVTYMVFLFGNVPDEIDRWKLVDTYAPIYNNGGFGDCGNIVVRNYYVVKHIEHGIISKELASYNDALNFITWEAKNPTKVNKWTFHDGNDIYEIIPCIDY